MYSTPPQTSRKSNICMSFETPAVAKQAPSISNSIELIIAVDGAVVRELLCLNCPATHIRSNSVKLERVRENCSRTGPLVPREIADGCLLVRTR